MNKLFKKIALRISLLFLVVIIASSVVSVVHLDKSYKENTKQSLLNQAKVIESIIAGGADIEDIANTLDDTMDMRVTIVALSGKVIFDTRAIAADLGNHLDRPEIVEALETGKGVNIRHSDTLEKDLMYAAIYSESQQLLIRTSMSLEGISAYSTALWLPLIIVLIVSFLLCLIISLLVSRRFTRPVLRLINDTKMIADGRYDDVKRLKTGDEMEALSGALSDMALALKHNIADITEKNSRLQAVFKAVPGGILAVDNDEMIIMANPAAIKLFSIAGNPEGKHFLEAVKHARLESVIKEAINSKGIVEKEISLIKGLDEFFLQVFAVSVVSNDSAYGVILFAQDITKIRKLENMRSDFAANVTHELKTPLTVISGFIDTLKDPNISKIDTDRFLDIISLESERLTRLIDDVLLLSEIENTGAVLSPLVDIRDGVEEVAALFENAAKDKGIDLNLNMSKDAILVAADMDRIKQMTINLVDNAIKYTSSGGSVGITVSKETNRGVISVTDTGIGIPEKNMSRLFERFYRVDKSRSRALGGTGLGLAIVKHIVNLLNGHVTVKSVVGEGTRFDVYLPIGNRK
ncbi:MAG: ATP-binding protein [Eubacteriales bacterium]|nr:ATP-binding protein [Eubacteriales bacterium]